MTRPSPPATARGSTTPGRRSTSCVTRCITPRASQADTEVRLGTEDRYARTEYRRLIAWESRIRREAPLFESLLDAAPDRSVLDIGCGTGEHVAWFADHGIRAVGVDASAAMLEKAREYESAGRGRFVAGDALDLAAALRETFGLAICLGNMLPHVLEDSGLARFFRGVRHALLPGGLFLLQSLNYERILAGGIRSLPVNLAPGDHEGEELALLRFMRPVSPERILFFPVTLTIDDASDPPVVLRNAKKVELRPWRADEIRAALETAGFEVTLHGDMTRGAYVPLESGDVVAIARARPMPPASASATNMNAARGAPGVIMPGESGQAAGGGTAG